MAIDLEVQYEIDSQDLPSVEQFQQWVDLALQNHQQDAELCIRIVAPDESQSLNSEYRGKDKPTNVLSFPFEVPEDIPVNILGDLVICAQVVADEAKQQQKPENNHWAHMVIHGCLHLLGFDHIKEDEADEMEALEKSLLSNLDIPDPYQES